MVEDMRRIGLDASTWQAIRTMMRSAADGTERDDVNWEFPCESSRGIIGELKHDEDDEVTFVDANSVKIVESAQINYRLYFAEPSLCPEELWAMGVGVKSLHPQFVGTSQQDDLEIAALRASQCRLDGSDLHDFTP